MRKGTYTSHFWSFAVARATLEIIIKLRSISVALNNDLLASLLIPICNHLVATQLLHQQSNLRHPINITNSQKVTHKEIIPKQ